MFGFSALGFKVVRAFGGLLVLGFKVLLSRFQGVGCWGGVGQWG